MKILILGATGRTGQLLLTRALDQHHEVTVLVRNPSKLNFQHQQLRIIKGDVLDSQVLLTALQGQQAVISAIGRGQSLRSFDLITNLVNFLIPAMNESKVKRLIFLSGFGAGETSAQTNLIQTIIFKTFLQGIYSDKTRAEKKIRASNLDWTLVYPVQLIDAPSNGNYESAEKLDMKGMPKISRADVADFMLQELKANTFLKKGAVLR
ncbi:MAG: SDR family oxidoreductase [Cytophagales bacterium]|nr:SDR family oxidoreductase [Cytophagales bacterium]